METYASLLREYHFLAALTERADLPESMRALLPGIRQKLDALWREVSEAYADEGNWCRDAAMGLIQIKRIALPFNEPMYLYGVSVPVYSIISMQIFRAEVHRVTGEVRPVTKLLELKMPESEWGQSIAQSNGGYGCATLLEYLGNPLEAFDPANDPSYHQGQIVADAFEDALLKERNRMQETLEAALAQLDDKGRLGKRDAEAISKRLQTTMSNTVANLSFRGGQLIKLANERTMELANQINLRGKGE